jgi:uncharacterized cupin superfamily protein
MPTTSKNIEQPDETREFDKGKVQVLRVGDVEFGRATFQPGWKWSECVKPIAGTDSCQFDHNTYIESGRLHVAMDDGSEADLGPGDMAVIPAGHDAWVVGNDPVVAFDFSPGISGYAKG